MGSQHLRRSRGYAFEHGIVERFNTMSGWWARRLGGSSTGMPDIVATNNRTGTLLVIECKSTYSNEVYIPVDQVERCQKVCDGFGYYDDIHAIFAIKFAKHILKEGGQYKKRREQRIYYIDTGTDLDVWGSNNPPFRITYDRQIKAIYDKDASAMAYKMYWSPDRINAYPEYPMPWSK